MSFWDQLAAGLQGSMAKGIDVGSAGAQKALDRQAAAEALVQKHKLDEESKATTRKASLEDLLQLQKANPGAGIHTPEGYGVVPKDDSMQKLAYQLRKDAFQNRQEDQQAQHVRQLSEDVTKTKLPQAVSTLQRAEQAIPGITAGNAQFKSVGGIKNWLPNALVPFGESLGLLPKGSSDERSALQDLENIEIRDKSGTAVSSNEGARIKAARGMFGTASPEIINNAIRAQAEATRSGAQNTGAGYSPKVNQVYKAQGGLAAGPGDIYDLLSSGDPERAELLRLRGKSKGKR